MNIDKNYLYKKEEFVFLPGVIEALKFFQSADYKLIIVTNQSGIARGFFTEDDFHVLNEWMLDSLKSEGIEISGVYYCPHHPNAEIEQYRLRCDCRKPNIGMFRKAIADFSIDESKSWAIGDKSRDVSICESSLIRGVLLYNDYEGKEKNIYRIRGGLKEAAKKIINGEFK